MSRQVKAARSDTWGYEATQRSDSAKRVSCPERLMRSGGNDPIAVREAAKRAKEEAAAKEIAFKEAAEKYFTGKKSKELRSDRSRSNWKRAMELHAYPVMGDVLIGFSPEYPLTPPKSD